MEQPIGLKKELEGKHLVCKLHKALYGLKQAPIAWFDRLKDSLHQMGFQSSKADQSLFMRFTPTSTTFILVYVDDIIVTCSDQRDLRLLVDLLYYTFFLKDLGDLNYFLGIEV